VRLRCDAPRRCVAPSHLDWTDEIPLAFPAALEPDPGPGRLWSRQPRARAYGDVPGSKFHAYSNAHTDSCTAYASAYTKRHTSATYGYAAAYVHASATYGHAAAAYVHASASSPGPEPGDGNHEACHRHQCRPRRGGPGGQPPGQCRQDRPDRKRPEPTGGAQAGRPAGGQRLPRPAAARWRLRPGQSGAQGSDGPRLQRSASPFGPGQRQRRGRVRPPALQLLDR